MSPITAAGLEYDPVVPPTSGRSRAWRGVLVYFGLAEPQTPRRRSRSVQAAVAAMYIIFAAYWLLTAAFGGGSILHWLLGVAFLVLAAVNFWQARGRQRS
ncbi:MAG: hypothetical protein M3Y17_00125 [Actinomycetota bacterium]|nr:hypothetical protein [Actinomycetota bacterium]